MRKTKIEMNTKSDKDNGFEIKGGLNQRYENINQRNKA